MFGSLVSLNDNIDSSQFLYGLSNEMGGVVGEWWGGEGRIAK